MFPTLLSFFSFNIHTSTPHFLSLFGRKMKKLVGGKKKRGEKVGNKRVRWIEKKRN